MTNRWKVIWFENNKKYFKNKFEGDSPKASGAIEFAKKIAARGILVSNIHVVSKRKGFAPPLLKRGQKIESGSMWCPYCLKYRIFREFAVKKPDFVTPVVYRCPICTISINDYYVRLYNPVMVIRLDPEVRRAISKPNSRRKV